MALGRTGQLMTRTIAPARSRLRSQLGQITHEATTSRTLVTSYSYLAADIGSTQSVSSSDLMTMAQVLLN